VNGFHAQQNDEGFNLHELLNIEGIVEHDADISNEIIADSPKPAIDGGSMTSGREKETSPQPTLGAFDTGTIIIRLIDAAAGLYNSSGLYPADAETQSQIVALALGFGITIIIMTAVLIVAWIFVNLRSRRDFGVHDI